VVSVPTTLGDAPLQFYYNVSSRGWGFWRDVPMESFVEFDDSVFFGDSTGRILRMDVPVDNLTLEEPEEGLRNGEDINFSILTAYSGLGLDGIYKRVKLIRPDFLGALAPDHSSQARYDYDLAEGDNFLTLPETDYTLGVWNISDWDAAIWGSNAQKSFPTISGAQGHGRYVAVATRGACRTATRLIGWDVIFDTGGMLL